MPGRIPESFIQSLLDRLDIVDVVGSRVTLKKTGKNYQGLCPFHEEKTPSFSVSPDRQFFHCFGCQESGSAITFVMKYENLDFVETVETLAKELGLEVPREGGGRPRKPKADPGLYEVLEQAERYFRRCLRTAPTVIEYLQSRGLTGEVARDFGIGYAPDGWQNLRENLTGVNEKLLLDAGLAIKSEKGRVYDRFRDRVMFPIRDSRGRVIAFGGRTLPAAGEGGGPKYMNSPETDVFQKGDQLYGLYEARKALRRIDQLLVVEGYMDVVALAQHGIANSVATLGTASGTTHFNKLFKHTDEVICCFDGDQAGRQAAWRALENALPTLNEHRQLKLAFLPDGEDPDSLVRKEGKNHFLELIDNAYPGLEFLFTRLAQGLDLDTVDGQARFAGLLNPYIEKVPEGVVRDLMRRRLSDVTGIGAGPRTVVRRRASREGSAQGKLNSMLQRLVTLLVKQPGALAGVDEEVQRDIAASGEQVGVLSELVEFLRGQNRVLDTEELLVHWSDHEKYDAILACARRNIDIEADAQVVEFCEGMNRLHQTLRAGARRQVLADLRESNDAEAFREYWALRGKPDSTEGS